MDEGEQLALPPCPLPVLRDQLQLHVAALDRAADLAGVDLHLLPVAVLRLAVHRPAEPELHDLHGVRRVVDRRGEIKYGRDRDVGRAVHLVRGLPQLLQPLAVGLPELHLVQRVDVCQILPVLDVPAPDAGIREDLLRADVRDPDVALMDAAAHLDIPVGLPEGVAQLQQPPLVGRVHVVELVVLDDVLHRQLPLLGLLAVLVVVPAPELRLRHDWVDLALHHDPRIRADRRRPRQPPLLREVLDLRADVVDEVVIVVVFFPLALPDRPRGLGLVEQRRDVLQPLLLRGKVIPGDQRPVVFLLHSLTSWQNCP